MLRHSWVASTLVRKGNEARGRVNPASSRQTFPIWKDSLRMVRNSVRTAPLNQTGEARAKEGRFAHFVGAVLFGWNAGVLAIRCSGAYELWVGKSL